MRNSTPIEFDRLTEIIKESVERFLNEELSISDDVIEAKNTIIDTVYDLYNRGVYRRYNTPIKEKDQLTLIDTVDFNMAISESIHNFSRLKEVEVIMYAFKDKNEMLKYYYALDIGGSSILSDGKIVVLTSIIGGEINRDQFEPILTHELEHFYQHSMSNGNISYNNAYAHAVEVIEKPTVYSKLEVVIAQLIYFFDKKEVDVKMHELEFDLSNVNGNLTATHIHKAKEVIMSKCYSVFKDAGINDVENAVKAFGISYKEAFRMINRGIRYFETKEGKVLQRYINHLNDDIKLTNRSGRI